MLSQCSITGRSILRSFCPLKPNRRKHIPGNALPLKNFGIALIPGMQDDLDRLPGAGEPDPFVDLIQREDVGDELI